MRRAVTAAAAALLLIGPTVLAFFSGGYFAQPRLVAAIVVWSLVLALAATGPAPMPRGTGGRLALAGFGLLTAWTAVSVTWAPLRGPAIESLELLVLYTGALTVAAAVFRTPRTLSALEPALAAGAALVIGYGLSGRLLPGIIELDRSKSAGGRLEQPITYWNSEGALAAMGVVLCARLAGDRSRPPAMRALAAAAVAPLGAGVYLSYSRGAIAVAMLGLAILVAAAPSRAQLRAAGVALATGAASAATAAFPGVASLAGTLSDREREGAIALLLLACLAGSAAALTARWARAEHDRPGADAPLASSRRLAPLAAVAAAAVAAGLVLGGLGERPSEAQLSAGAAPGRLTTVSSNRYEYWRVGIDAFAHEPIRGLGAGGFRVAWLRERSIPEAVRDAHSLEVEIAAELGLAGLLMLALVLGGVAVAARDALLTRQGAAAGPCAAVLTWFLHASIDWDWQLPAVTLPAIVLAGGLIALADATPPRVNARAR